MIRQAISCDICGAEKKQTNHWFVAWEQTGELRVSGWNSRNRLRTGSKHLCGQACLHKLADDFMARVIAQKVAGKLAAEEDADLEERAGEMPVAAASSAAIRRAVDKDSAMRASAAPTLRAAHDLSAAPSLNAAHDLNAAARAMADTSLTLPGAHAEFESSARLLPSEPAVPAQTAARAVTGLVAIRERQPSGGSMPAAPDEPPRFASRNWRAEAWQRERERTRRPGERRPNIVARRIGSGD